MFAKRLAAPLCIALLATTTSAAAKDWIETVSLTKNGIDVTPIVVSADMSGYGSVKTPSHRFLLRLHARATSGERIVAMMLGAYHGVRYFEASGGLWQRGFQGRDVGAGTKRTVTLEVAQVLPIGQIKWAGATPTQACEANLAKETAKGMPRHVALGKEWTVTARAQFGLDAVAARKSKSGAGEWSLANTDSQTANFLYDVTVRCQSGLKKSS